MNVLYIADFLYFIDGGAHVSACAHRNTLINMFGKENVKIIALTGPNKSNGEYCEDLNISGEKCKLKQFINCCMGYTTYLDKKGINNILYFVRNHDIDVVFLDNSIFGRLVKSAKMEFPSLPIVTYYHDVKASLAADWKNNAPIYKKVVYQAMIYNERLNQQYCDVNMVLNPREERLFINAYKKKPELQLGVYMDVQLDEDYLRAENTLSLPLHIIFIGSHYAPNVKGVKWFIDRVLSNIDVAVNLTVAGSRMELLKNEINNIPQNVTIMGHVEDLSILYKKADLVISPIFEGGGMKVKVSHAIAYGKIILGTDESFEGYKENIQPEQWDRYFYRCNSAEDYIRAISMIVKNHELRKFNPVIRELFDTFYSEHYAQKIIQQAIDIALIKQHSRGVSN